MQFKSPDRPFVFSRRKSKAPFANLLAWDGNTQSPVPLSELAKERRALEKLLAQKSSQLDRAIAETGQEASALRKPARTLCSYRADILAGPLPAKKLVKLSNKQKLSADCSVFHNCTLKEMIFHQSPANRKSGAAPFAVNLEVFGFSGDYFSLSFELPAALTSNFEKGDLFKIDFKARSDTPMDAYLRLNTSDGPNRKDHSEYAQTSGKIERVSFDPAALGMPLNQGFWFDLLMDKVAFNRITLDDLVIHRCQTAEL